MLNLCPFPLLSFTESLPNISHLWDPQSHSFIRYHNEIQNAPALDCHANGSGCTLSYTCRQVSPHLSYPTPVAQLSANQRRLFFKVGLSCCQIWENVTDSCFFSRCRTYVRKQGAFSHHLHYVDPRTVENNLQ